MTTGFTGMPPKVATAVNAAMKAVKRLEKGDFNKHGGFKFTSIDDFLDATRPICAEAGLIVVQDEDHFEIIPSAKPDKPDDAWLLIRYAFTLAHASGETWDKRIMRTIMVRASMGSQAFGAAQSYVEKQFMRSLLQMSTGDGEDADSHEQSNLPPRGRSESSRAQQTGTGRKSSASVIAAKNAILQSDPDALPNWLKDNANALAECSKDDRAEIEAFFKAHTAPYVKPSNGLADDVFPGDVQ